MDHVTQRHSGRERLFPSARIVALLAVCGIVGMGIRTAIVKSQERKAVAALGRTGVAIAYSGTPLLSFRRPAPVAFLFAAQDAARVDWSLLRALRTLNQAQFAGTRNVDRSLEVLAELPSLENLFLEDTDVSAEGLRVLTRSPSLKSLSLAGTVLSKESLAALQGYRHLERLDLSRCHFLSQDLAALHGHPTVRVLDLRKTELIDDDVDVLAGFSGCELLMLDETRLTAAGVEALRTRLPGVRVHWDGAE